MWCADDIQRPTFESVWMDISNQGIYIPAYVNRSIRGCIEKKITDEATLLQFCLNTVNTCFVQF